MSIQIGDKVRFLNSTGGGIVRSFKGKDQVIVEDENGFDVPVLIRECVVTGEGSMRIHSKLKPSVTPPPAVVANPPKPIPQEEKVTETPGGDRLNVYLAYLPIDPKALQQTGYEAYLINDSNYFLSFNYMNRQNNSWLSRQNGTIEPNMQIFLEEFQKEDLNALERICVQFIAFKKNKPYMLKNAVSVELHPDTVKFYKLHCFMENDFFDENALIYPIVRDDVPERELLVSATELEEAMRQKQQENRRIPKQVTHKKQEDPIVEIDLHINQLIDTTAGMSNADMLQYQLDTFHKTLKSHEKMKGKKIVFIHGKGDGVLRKAIETELKTKYKTYYYQDASFREYGFGATMVTIR